MRAEPIAKQKRGATRPTRSLASLAHDLLARFARSKPCGRSRHTRPTKCSDRQAQAGRTPASLLPVMRRAQHGQMLAPARPTCLQAPWSARPRAQAANAATIPPPSLPKSGCLPPYGPQTPFLSACALSLRLVLGRSVVGRCRGISSFFGVVQLRLPPFLLLQAHQAPPQDAAAAIGAATRDGRRRAVGPRLPTALSSVGPRLPTEVRLLASSARPVGAASAHR